MDVDNSSYPQSDMGGSTKPYVKPEVLASGGGCTCGTSDSPCTGPGSCGACNCEERLGGTPSMQPLTAGAMEKPGAFTGEAMLPSTGRVSGSTENAASNMPGTQVGNFKHVAPNKMLAGASLIVDHIKDLGYDSKEDLANFEGTEERMMRAYAEFIMPKAAIHAGLTKILSTCFPMTGDAGIVIQECVTIGMCPHHLLPVIHQMYVGYLPKDNGNILGMSKLIRIAELLSKRAILQEQLAIDITATLFNGHYDDAGTQPTGFPFIETAGAICIMGSLHCCMATRGVRSFSLAREVSLRGAFMHDKNLKDEAFKIINQFPSTQFPLK